ncbi:hypothetical protein [Aeromonas enteropelogenes]|uniref:hypothetical protein n=1 Tax=Aeromonas enteropelogenes TaxID=29489 RepID=UPI003BA2456D
MKLERVWVVGFLMVTLAVGYGVYLGGSYYISQSQARLCVQGLEGSLPSWEAEKCAVLFTKPEVYVKLTNSGDVLLGGFQISRYDLSKIHKAVLDSSPESMTGVASFDLWWSNLPVGGS